MTPIPTTHDTLDIVGTGGDHAHTVNISTGSAILAASCGIKIAKHGNRAQSSLAGSADVLEALDIVLELTPEAVAGSIDQVNIGFCYAPRFHPALQQLRALRRELKIPTTFNLLGPLLNPANASYLLLGVADEKSLITMATVLQKMSVKQALVVHGAPLDELSTLGPAKAIHVAQAISEITTIDPSDYQLAPAVLSELQGGDAKTNAAILLAAFKGKASAVADTLVLNTAYALHLYGKHDSIKIALQHARENLENGRALKLLDHWRAYTHDHKTCTHYSTKKA